MALVACSIASDLAQVKVTSPTSITVIYDGATFNWTTGDFTGKNDDVNVVKHTSTPLTTGAWVRQTAEKVSFPSDVGTLLGSVQDALSARGAPPAVLSERFYLTNRMTAAEITDCATQTGAINLSPKLQQLINDAAGREIYLPEGGLIKLQSSVSYVPSAPVAGQMYRGLKLFGTQGTTIRGPADFAIDIGTGAIFKFQDQCILSGFTIDGMNAAGSKGIRMERAYRVLIDSLNINHMKGDGIFVAVTQNDAGSSNNIEVVRTNMVGIGGWGFNHAPLPGANDLSYLWMHHCLFNACGTPEWKSITGITKANPGVVTCIGHGFVTGQKIRIGGVFGMFEVNTAYVFTVTVINANQFSIGVNTSNFGAYVSGGRAFPAVPGSGAVKLQTQASRLSDFAVTETQNCGFYIGGQAFRTAFENVTAENTNGISVLIDGGSGVSIRNSDLRCNASVATNFAHVLLDGTTRPVAAVDLIGNSIIQFNGSAPLVVDNPHTAFQAIGPNLGRIHIEGTNFYAYDTANQKRYGDGLFTATSPTLSDGYGGTAFEPGAAVNQSFAAANPVYTPDIRKGQTHILTLSPGASGTLTVNLPNIGGLGGLALNGAPLNVLLVNNSGGVAPINLVWNLPTKGAPATIAAGETKSGTWRFSSSYGWMQAAAWA
ncbi:MAG: hypothetical protein KA144_03455 [Xanthomonadaceae bacterium]|nr:hypothetical protein [Xanthomonadaceae bacterium]